MAKRGYKIELTCLAGSSLPANGSYPKSYETPYKITTTPSVSSDKIRASVYSCYGQPGNADYQRVLRQPDKVGYYVKYAEQIGNTGMLEWLYWTPDADKMINNTVVKCQNRFTLKVTEYYQNHFTNPNRYVEIEVWVDGFEQNKAILTITGPRTQLIKYE